MQDKTTVQRDVFARRLRGLAEAAELTQAEIARRLQLTPPVVGNWFQGRNLPETTVLPMLADVLNTSIDNLFGQYSTSPHSLDGPEKAKKGEVQVANPGAAAELQRRIHDHIGSLVHAAWPDVQRLGWVAEQLRQHVSAPHHWGTENERGLSPLHKSVLNQQLNEERAILEEQRRSQESGSSTKKTQGIDGK